MAHVVLHQAAQVLTLAGPAGPRIGHAFGGLSILKDGSVALADDGSIAWVGPADELTLDVGAKLVDCRGKVLMPALVDCHTHLVWGGHRKDELELRLRGADYEEIFAAGGGILSSVRQTRDTTADDLYEQSLARAKRMRRAGTTTFEIKSGYGLDLETEIRQLEVARRLQREAGFRVLTTCLAAHAIPAEARRNENGRHRFLDRICEEILPAVVERDLADFCDAFCDRGAFTVGESRRVLTRAKELGLALRVHANEFGHTGGATLAAELGARSADHLLYLNEEERNALREAKTTAVLLPGTSFVLGKPFANGRALIEAGVPVAVATDCNPGSCAIENLAMVLGLACYGNRLTPAEAVVAATHNAAVSLGVADVVGRLEPGLSADLLVLGTDDYRDLIYHVGSPLIEQVYAAGKRVPA